MTSLSGSKGSDARVATLGVQVIVPSISAWPSGADFAM
jgi:hypothetical protein